MVDMCIYASVNHDEKLKAAVVEFSKRSPTTSVNHTDFTITQDRPILISIETKKHGAQGDKAQAQMSVWHAAQWSFLRWAVGQKLLRQQQALGLDAPITDEEQREHTALKLAALEKLGFIPGIIVQGHRWHLVLSTYSAGKTTLWAEWEFGSTKGLLDICQVVAGVRELTAWGRDVYLPWFKENVLD